MDIAWYIAGALFLGLLASPLYASVFSLCFHQFQHAPWGFAVLFMTILLGPIVVLMIGLEQAHQHPLQAPLLMAGLLTLFVAWAVALFHTFQPKLFLVPLVGGVWPRAGWMLWKLEARTMNDMSRGRRREHWASSRWVQRSSDMQQEILERGTDRARRLLIAHLRGTAFLRAYRHESGQDSDNLLRGLKLRWQEGHESPGAEALQQMLQDPRQQVRAWALRWAQSRTT